MTAQDIPGGKLQPLSGITAWLLTARGVAAFWIVYGLIHAIFRFSASHTLALDDARATELVQHLAPGYQARQPPLYEWLLWCAQQWLGTGISSDLAVRYALLALLGIACFGACRAVLKDERWAAAASLSLAASYPVGWAFHEWGTQTVLLCIACFATFHAAMVWLEKPSLRAAFWLGAAIGLGLLSKFSYPLFAAGLVLACLGMRETRRRLADPRLVVTAAVALAMIAPYLFWLLQVRGDVVAVDSTLAPFGKPYLRRTLTGLARLVKALPLFLLPWLLFLALLAPRAFGYGGRAAASQATMGERLAFYTMAIAAVLAVLVVIVLGASDIAERYIHPILIIAPVYVFARIRRFQQGEAVLRRLALFMAGAAAAVLLVRVAVFCDCLPHRTERAAQIPYQALAAMLDARGIRDGTVITLDVRDAGNLRALLPGLRVIAVNSRRVERPPRRASDDRSCMLLYSRGSAKEHDKLAAFGAIEPEQIDVAARSAWFGVLRQGTWWLARLDPLTAACH